MKLNAAAVIIYAALLPCPAVAQANLNVDYEDRTNMTVNGWMAVDTAWLTDDYSGSTMHSHVEISKSGSKPPSIVLDRGMPRAMSDHSLPFTLILVSSPATHRMALMTRRHNLSGAKCSAAGVRRISKNGINADIRRGLAASPDCARLSGTHIPTCIFVKLILYSRLL